MKTFVDDGATVFEGRIEEDARSFDAQINQQHLPDHEPATVVVAAEVIAALGNKSNSARKERRRVKTLRWTHMTSADRELIVGGSGAELLVGNSPRTGIRGRI